MARPSYKYITNLGERQKKKKNEKKTGSTYSLFYSYFLLWKPKRLVLHTQSISLRCSHRETYYLIEVRHNSMLLVVSGKVVHVWACTIVHVCANVHWDLCAWNVTTKIEFRTNNSRVPIRRVRRHFSGEFSYSNSQRQKKKTSHVVEISLCLLYK